MRSWLRRHLTFHGFVIWWCWGLGIEVIVSLADVTVALSLGPLFGSVAYTWWEGDDGAG